MNFNTVDAQIIAPPPPPSGGFGNGDIDIYAKQEDKIPKKCEPGGWAYEPCFNELDSGYQDCTDWAKHCEVKYPIGNYIEKILFLTFLIILFRLNTNFFQNRLPLLPK